MCSYVGKPGILLKDILWVFFLLLLVSRASDFSFSVELWNIQQHTWTSSTRETVGTSINKSGFRLMSLIWTVAFQSLHLLIYKMRWFQTMNGQRGWALGFWSWPWSLWLLICRKNTQSIWPCSHLSSCSVLLPLIFKWTCCHRLSFSGACTPGCFPAKGTDVCWFTNTYFPRCCLFRHLR